MRSKEKKIVLAIAGDIAAGKNAMADYIEKKYGGHSYRSSEVLRDILQRLDLPESRENMQKTSTMIREHFGKDIISKVAAFDLSKIKNKIIAINGVRRLSDIEALKKDFTVKLIYVEADAKKRFERIGRRKENSDERQKTFAQFKKDHLKEAEGQIGSLKKEADFVILNNSTKRDFYREIDEVIKKIIK
ncbi:MAG: AAA family ATPase [Parcubacteria group bacterium]